LKKTWILFVALRYILKGRASSPVLAILGIAVGVFALIVIISVMNGFQLGFIESILEISSYHLRLGNFSEEKIPELQEIMLSIPGIEAAVPFKEFQALARGRRAGQQAVLVRGLYENTLEIDKLMESRLDFLEGSFDISDSGDILLGSELARRLGLGIGDTVTLFSITGILSAQDEGGLESFVVKGIFKTGYYDYDCSWAFINLDKVKYLDSESDIILGIKIANRFNDRFFLEQARTRLLDYDDIKISSWRDYNRSFFSALRTEKLFMFILVGLIFIVVGLNIFQAQRRAVLQRKEEIGLLRAVGGNRNAVQFIFVLDGGVIGFIGACLGLALGLAVALNIVQFFSAVEFVVNAVIDFINMAAVFFGMGMRENFAIFSPAVFYIKEIPSRVLFQEVVFIFLFGFISALIAAWLASGRAVKIQPAEVLRYE
jgi:lipoprotein-releasing system permease protein